MPSLGWCLPGSTLTQEDLTQSRRLLIGISFISLGLWVWVLAETIIFLLIVKNVQAQNNLLEEQLAVLSADMGHLQNEATASPIVRMKRDGESQISSDARFVHFLNLELSLAISSDGAILYWMPNQMATNPSQLKEEEDFEMSSDGSRVRVLASGLYLVYAQLDWDLGHHEVGHLQLRVSRNTNSTVMAACTVGGKAAQGVDERTCYTSTVSYLRRNQQIWVSTPSAGAQLNGAPEKSFFGIVKL